MQNGSESTEDSLESRGRRRLNHLDWLRVLMVFCVVYGHITRVGLESGVNGEIQVDDRTYIGAYGGEHMARAAALQVRWVSLFRQWCAPLLFWVSGGATSCCLGELKRPVKKLLCLLVLGVGLNVFLWVLGPMNPQCDPASRCPGKGSLFNFTIVPWAGWVYPLIYQMWYVIYVLLFMLMNLGIFEQFREERLSLWKCGVQFGATCLVFFLVTLTRMSEFPYLILLLVLLVAYEAAFIAMAASCIPGVGPDWLPRRAKHYLAGVALVLQFASTPMANSMNLLSRPFGLYSIVGFHKFYTLGFVMTHARSVEPLASNLWPLVAVCGALCLPSTNWYLAGNLMFPYYPRTSDRVQYVVGSVLLVFVVDRLGRLRNPAPLPDVLHWFSLVMYVAHPVFMTTLIAFHVEGVPHIFCGCVVLSLAMALVLRLALPDRRHKEVSRDLEEEQESE